MKQNPRNNKKLYYSIKEVAEMFDVNESTLRYWEKAIPYLKPKTTKSAGIRQYQEKDIEQIRLIYNLVKVGDLKLAAVKRIMMYNRKGAVNKSDVLESLMRIKTELQTLKKQMDYLQ
jgi:DNA-binding transcriptional MerR regulator